MNETSSLHAMDPDRPNAQLVRRDGWTIGATFGSYCLAWREGEEAILVWREGQWQPVSGASRIAS